MSEKKILFITTAPTMISQFLLPFADRFRALGWQVDAMSANLNLAYEISKHFDQLWTVNFSRNPLNVSNLLLLKQIVAVIKNNNYRIVHVHSPIAAFLCRLALKFISKPQRPKIVYTAHGFHFYRGGNLFNNAIFFSLEKMVGPWTDRLITINIEDYWAARKKKIVPRSRLLYMPGIGVDTNYYIKSQVAAEKISQLRNSLKVKQHEVIFLMAAEFTKQKRQRLVIEAFLESGLTQAHLILAGVGQCYGKLKKFVEKRQLTEKVHLIGYRQDIPTLMCSSVATVLVSKREGLPRVVLESLSLETPVIGSNIRGNRDLLRKNGGILIDRIDKNKLAKAMQSMLSNATATALVSANTARRLKKYSLENILLLHEKLYSQLLNE